MPIASVLFDPCHRHQRRVAADNHAFSLVRDFCFVLEIRQQIVFNYVAAESAIRLVLFFVVDDEYAYNHSSRSTIGGTNCSIVLRSFGCRITK